MFKEKAGKERTEGDRNGQEWTVDDVSQEIELFKGFLNGEELSKNTRTSYIYALKLFLERYSTISKENIVDWKNDLLSSMRASSVNLRLSGLRKYCEFRGVPFYVKKVQVQKQSSVSNVITVKEYRALIEGLNADGNKRWAAYYMILAKTGVRVSEFLRLKKGDLERGSVDMVTKGKVRTILFPDTLVLDVSLVFSSLGKDDFLCVNRYGNPMTARGFSMMLKKHAKRYGVPMKSAHPHSFRHLFAIEFLKNNKNISLLADLLGHSGVNTTMIYLRMSQEDQAAELNQSVNW